MLFPGNELTRVIELAGNIWMETRARLESRLRPLTMTWPQFGMLLALRQHDGVTQRELGDVLECDRTTVSVICDSLERRGWAERQADPTDRRAKRVFLTEAGIAILGQAEDIVWAVYRSIAHVLAEEEIAAVAPKLDRVHEALKTVPKDPEADAPVVDTEAR